MDTPHEAPLGDAPGPRGLPLVGSALDLIRDILGTSLNAHRRYGDMVRFVAGPPGRYRVLLYSLGNPESVQYVYTTGSGNYAKQDPGYIELRTLLGEGLLTSENEPWLRQKRMLQPLFTRNRIATYASMIAEETAKMIEAWRGRDTVDLHEEMTTFSLRVVCRALFPTDVDKLVPVLRKQIPYLSKRAFRRSIAPVRIPNHWPTPGNRKARCALNALYRIVEDMIAERRTQPDDSQDLLTLLIAAQDPEGGQPLSDSEVRDQALTFLTAGHETTATSLTFALHLLGRHPDVQQGVRDEAARVMGDRLPTAQESKELHRTTMAIKEAMRLFPAVYATPRKAIADDVIAGYRIPAGSMVVPAVHLIHGHPDLWPDPERYDPERFTPAMEKSRHRYAYIPFGGGPRACIGQHFSMLETIIAVAMLARAFEFTTPPGKVKLFTGITLRPAQPMPCKISAARHP